MFGFVEFWAQRTVSPVDGREGWTVVDDGYVEHERAASWFRVLLDAQGRSVGTARVYAGRLALYLTWAAAEGVDPVAPDVDQLAAFARWLERTPSRKHRPGRQRRRSPELKVVVLGTARSAATVEGILAAVVEFVRFCASRGWCAPTVAERLSVRTELRFVPRRWDRGEREGRAAIDRRVVRRRRVEQPPSALSRDQVACLVDACSNIRDRFIVEGLYATGLRVAELCGLHLADLHLLPSAAHLGCKVVGAHLHVVRREDNENRALAKSVWPRVLPVTKDLVVCHDAYRFSVTRWRRRPRATTCWSICGGRRWGGRCRLMGWSACLSVCHPGSVSGPGLTCCATASLLRWPLPPRTRRWSRSYWVTPRSARATSTCMPAGRTCGPRWTACSAREEPFDEPGRLVDGGVAASREPRPRC